MDDPTQTLLMASFCKMSVKYLSTCYFINKGQQDFSSANMLCAKKKHRQLVTVNLLPSLFSKVLSLLEQANWAH